MGVNMSLDGSLFYIVLLVGTPCYQQCYGTQTANYDDDIYMVFAIDCVFLRQCNNGFYIELDLGRREQRKSTLLCFSHICFSEFVFLIEFLMKANRLYLYLIKAAYNVHRSWVSVC